MATTKKKTPAKKNTNRATKVDWLSIRKSYLSDSTISYSDLAKTYKVSKTAIERKAKAESWVELRQELGEKAFNNFTEKLLDQKSSAQSRHLQHWQNLQAIANNSIIHFAERSYERDRRGNLIIIKDKDGNLNPIPRPVNTTELVNVAKAIKIAIDGERVTLGLPTGVSALSDPEGGSVWSGFAELMKAADEVLDEHGETVE